MADEKNNEGLSKIVSEEGEGIFSREDGADLAEGRFVPYIIGVSSLVHGTLGAISTFQGDYEAAINMGIISVALGGLAAAAHKFMKKCDNYISC